jgi:hypothetical protein
LSPTLTSSKEIGEVDARLKIIKITLFIKLNLSQLQATIQSDHEN